MSEELHDEPVILPLGSSAESATPTLPKYDAGSQRIGMVQPKEVRTNMTYDNSTWRDAVSPSVVVEGGKEN